MKEAMIFMRSSKQHSMHPKLIAYSDRIDWKRGQQGKHTGGGWCGEGKNHRCT